MAAGNEIANTFESAKEATGLGGIFANFVKQAFNSPMPGMDMSSANASLAQNFDMGNPPTINMQA